jgi:hypothetical protein
MAISRKNKRRITVDGVQYFYAATGNDGYIHLWVMTEVEGSPRLSAYFEYHHDSAPLTLRDGMTAAHRSNKFVVTPYTVRQVICYALQAGWNPMKRGKDLALGHLDDKIDLRRCTAKEHTAFDSSG